MPMDPISFWIQASVFWASVFKQQHDAYLKMLGAVAVTVPHPTAADLSAQAQAQAAPDLPKAVKLVTPKKPATPRVAVAKAVEPVIA